MAQANRSTIDVLLNTAAALERADDYQWGHMGSCNCGFLAREISLADKDSIHSAAMQRYGNWTEQLNDYCPTSGLLMDDLITTMLDAGFDVDDLSQLETLSNVDILRSLPPQHRYLEHNIKEDVVVYLRGWAEYLEGILGQRSAYNGTRNCIQSFGSFPWLTNRRHLGSLASSMNPLFIRTRAEAVFSASTKL